MARYRFYLEGYVEIETPRTPAQIRNAFVNGTSIRELIKDAYRDKAALDGTGETVIESWVLQTDNVRPMDGGADIDLDEGATEEIEP